MSSLGRLEVKKKIFGAFGFGFVLGASTSV